MSGLVGNPKDRFFRNMAIILLLYSQIIYIARNPKDVVVSFYYYICYLKPVTRYDGKFKDFCDLFIQDKGSLHISYQNCSGAIEIGSLRYNIILYFTVKTNVYQNLIKLVFSLI